jgi:hypothetical protein
MPATVPPARLRAAAVLIVAEMVVEAVVIARRTELVPGFRVCLVLVLSLKLVWAAGALRLRAGAALGLFMIEGVSALAALGATDAPLGARLALATTALTAIALVAASLHAFPEASLP